MINPQDFKIRCSSIHRIMGGNVGLSESQEAEHIKLIERHKSSFKAVGGVKALTDIMLNRLQELDNVKQNPQLPQGAKTYCEEWIKKELYGEGIRGDFKYTSKGLEMEAEALAFVAESYGYGMLLKNDMRLDGEFITGESDNIQPTHTLDVKCSWMPNSFPLFDTELDKAYYWQGVGYMHLYERLKHKVFYCLMNTPAHLIENEYKSLTYKGGHNEEEGEELFNELTKKMTFDSLPNDLRIKKFEFDFNPSEIDEIIKRVKMCRTYIEKLCKQLTK